MYFDKAFAGAGAGGEGGGGRVPYTFLLAASIMQGKEPML